MNTRLLQETIEEFAPVEAKREHKGILEIDPTLYPSIGCESCEHFLDKNNVCYCLESNQFGKEVKASYICLRWEERE